MLTKYFVQKVTKVAIKRTSYGDFTVDPSGVSYDLYCRMRDYSEGVRVEPTGEEQLRPERQAWFPPTADIHENDVLLYENAYWEISRVREARRGRSDKIEFLKVSLFKHAIVS